jgi:hypothetical protein
MKRWTCLVLSEARLRTLAANCIGLPLDFGE